jgi:hypothetical protein
MNAPAMIEAGRLIRSQMISKVLISQESCASNAAVTSSRLA